MGLLRLILAACVVFAHTGGVTGYVLPGGDLAVQCFFIVSGFMIAFVLEAKYSGTSGVRAFYLNRVLRIFPLYWIALALTGFLFVATRQYADPGFRGLGPASMLYVAIGNLFLFGQDLALFLQRAGTHFVFAESVQAAMRPAYVFMIVHQAWSLALELMFYLLAPWLAKCRTSVLLGMIVLSTTARAIAAALGLAGDPWLYRFFPFEISMFLIGMCGFRFYAIHIRGKALSVGGSGLAIGVILAILSYPFWVRSPELVFFSGPRLAILIGTAVALPFLFAFSRRSVADRLIGELSYPVYLFHLVALPIVRRLSGEQPHSLGLGLAVLAVSIFVSIIAIRLVEAPINRMRSKIAGGAQSRILEASC